MNFSRIVGWDCMQIYSSICWKSFSGAIGNFVSYFRNFSFISAIVCLVFNCKLKFIAILVPIFQNVRLESFGEIYLKSDNLNFIDSSSRLTLCSWFKRILSLGFALNVNMKSWIYNGSHAACSNLISWDSYFPSCATISYVQLSSFFNQKEKFQSLSSIEMFKSTFTYATDEFRVSS